MTNYPDIFFQNKELQSNCLNKNLIIESPYKRNIDSYFFNRAKSIKKSKLKLKLFDTPLDKKPNNFLEKLVTADTTESTDKNKEQNLNSNDFSSISNSSKSNIVNLHKKYNQRNSSKNKYLKEKIGQSLDVNRPKLIIKKTRPSFYLPKLINIPSPSKDYNLDTESSLNKDFFSSKEIDDNFRKKNLRLYSEDNLTNQHKSIEPIFIEKRIKYYNLKNVRFNIKNPIERNRVMKYIVNFNRILTINKC